MGGNSVETGGHRPHAPRFLEANIKSLKQSGLEGKTKWEKARCWATRWERRAEASRGEARETRGSAARIERERERESDSWRARKSYVARGEKERDRHVAPDWERERERATQKSEKERSTRVQATWWKVFPYIGARESERAREPSTKLSLGTTVYIFIISKRWLLFSLIPIPACGQSHNQKYNTTQNCCCTYNCSFYKSYCGVYLFAASTICFKFCCKVLAVAFEQTIVASSTSCFFSRASRSPLLAASARRTPI